MRLRRGEHGYTLSELVVAMSVIAILALVVVNFFGTIMMQNTIALARAELLGQAHEALDTVNDDIRLSARVDENNRWDDEHAPNAPSNLLSWESDDQTMVLASVVEDDDGNILFEDASEYISWKDNTVYYVENGTLYRRVVAADVEDNAAQTTCPESAATSECPADRALLDNVEHFEIRYLDGNNQVVDPADARSVELEIELKIRAYGRDITADYTTRMVFRNA